MFRKNILCQFPELIPLMKFYRLVVRMKNSLPGISGGVKLETYEDLTITKLRELYVAQRCNPAWRLASINID